MVELGILRGYLDGAECKNGGIYILRGKEKIEMQDMQEDGTLKWISSTGRQTTGFNGVCISSGKILYPSYDDEWYVFDKEILILQEIPHEV